MVVEVQIICSEDNQKAHWNRVDDSQSKFTMSFCFQKSELHFAQCKKGASGRMIRSSVDTKDGSVHCVRDLNRLVSSVHKIDALYTQLINDIRFKNDCYQ